MIVMWMWVKQCHKPSHSHHHRWYGYHSQSWVVYDIVFLPTLMMIEWDYSGKKLISWDILWDSPNAMGNSGIFIGEDGLIYIYILIWDSVGYLVNGLWDTYNQHSPSLRFMKSGLLVLGRCLLTDSQSWLVNG